MHKEDELILSTLGIFKIKYSILDTLNINDIDIFHIDLNTILETLFKIKNIFDDGSSYLFTIASSIINLVAHFRSYFVKKQNNTTIYLYYSHGKVDNKNLSDNIDDTLSLLSVIVKYIPKVYLIDDKKTDIKLCMNYLIKEDKINYIFTKNKIFFQFVNIKNTFILRPARDDSYIINSKNLYNKLANNDVKYTVSSKLLTAILSFTGVNQYKGVKGMGIKKVLKMFQKSIDKNIIVNDYYLNISDLLYDLSCNKETCKIVKDIFEKIDVNLLNVITRNNPYEIEIQNSLVDKFSKKDLQELNTKYFTGFNSLMLQELLLEPTKSKNNKKSKITW